MLPQKRDRSWRSSSRLFAAANQSRNRARTALTVLGASWRTLIQSDGLTIEVAGVNKVRVNRRRCLPVIDARACSTSAARTWARFTTSLMSL